MYSIKCDNCNWTFIPRHQDKYQIPQRCPMCQRAFKQEVRLRIYGSREEIEKIKEKNTNIVGMTYVINDINSSININNGN